MTNHDSRSVLIFTVHKAASMFMHGITIQSCAALDIPYYSPNLERYFSQIIGSSWIEFLRKHQEFGCFGQIRPADADPCIPENLADYRVVLHLRDPRDMLTSLYYSVAYSHPRTAGGFNPSDEERERWVRDGVDKYALDHCEEIRGRYELLLRNVYGRDDVVFMKYEELITDYPGWLRRFLSAFDHTPGGRRRRWGPLSRENRLESVYRTLAEKYKNEFLPVAENVHSHKRQVMSGDYLRKLKPETIEVINGKFAEILETLDYRA